MNKFFKIAGITFLFMLLTVLTQVGGILLLMSILIANKLRIQTSLHKVGLFILIYVFATFIIVPPIAEIFGRQALPISSKGQVIPNNIMMCLLHRHYVSPTLYKLIHSVASQMNPKKESTVQLRYLDANFPFIDGFPLLPHRSHDDGNKLDLAFMYVHRADHKAWKHRVSFLGYGFFEKPLRGEVNIPQQCAQKGYWQYGLLEKIPGLKTHDKVQLDEFSTAKLIKLLSKHPDTKKIFIEPHLKNRLGFANDSKVRFHGCAAVRHDDHIHIEL
jgi:hypothetical protein